MLGRGGAYLIDPGPAIEEHVDAVLAEAEARGGLAAIVLTHDHPDHSLATTAVRERTGAPVASSHEQADVVLGDGATIGPLTALATPGHAADHLAFIAGRVCFSGDAILGEGSVFVASYPGALVGYLNALRRLRELDLELIAPGHGSLITDPAARIDSYIEHRLDRERRIVDALAEGLRDEQLLDHVWPDVAAELRPIARATLEAHLGKLADEGRLPR
jgi:glyoxylase-like metal-dependent hydrolase (beta-lactamase superfamily II)